MISHFWRAFRGVAWREILRFLQQRERFLAALVRPILWLLIFAVGFRAALGVSIAPPYTTYITYDVYIAPGLVRSVPQIKFLLVGGGEWRARLESRVCSLGLKKHFVFTGLIAPEAIPSLMGIMDIVAHLSLREGLPRALPQAMAAARPVVAYDCDGAGEVCLDNETGFLLRPGDLAGLGDRLLRLAQDAALGLPLR